MTHEITIEIETKSRVVVTIEKLAEIFCGMDDEQQAQFFIECTKLAGNWKHPAHSQDQQWWSVGKHLGECTCSTDAAREMIHSIADGIKYGDEKRRKVVYEQPDLLTQSEQNR